MNAHSISFFFLQLLKEFNRLTNINITEKMTESLNIYATALKKISSGTVGNEPVAPPSESGEILRYCYIVFTCTFLFKILTSNIYFIILYC